MKKKYSYPKHKIKVLLLESIHPIAREVLESAGYSVEVRSSALGPDELEQVLPSVHILGVRSRTKIREGLFKFAPRLLAIGTFSVGTDHIDVNSARSHGVPVFNAPFSSTRSVAELAIGDMFMLARRAGDRNLEMHEGKWKKSAEGSRELRGKTIGIIGYGHIGQQVGLLGEALGLDVLFYDIRRRLPLGRNLPVSSLEELLLRADFVTLHIPGTKENENFIGAEEFHQMKQGGFFLNLSRGNVVDLNALYDSLKSGHLGGAALDVFPEEPESSRAEFQTQLMGLENVVLTPHVGGSTEEAQRSIGYEVAQALSAFIDSGATEGASNFPAINLPEFPKSHRILNVHHNLPGVLSDVNSVISRLGANIDAQYLSTCEDIGYLIMDVDKEISDEVKAEIAALPHSIKTRILY